MCAVAVTLDLARADDAAAIARMSRDLIEAGLGWKYHRAAIQQLLSDPDTLGLAARDRAGLAGFAIAQFSDHRAHLVLLAVLPRHQRQGIGRRLLQGVLSSAAVAGLADIELELRAGNLAAWRFYSTLGFSEIARVDGYYRQVESAIRMRRVLRDRHAVLPPWQAPTLRRR